MKLYTLCADTTAKLLQRTQEIAEIHSTVIAPAIRSETAEIIIQLIGKIEHPSTGIKSYFWHIALLEQDEQYNPLSELFQIIDINTLIQYAQNNKPIERLCNKSISKRERLGETTYKLSDLPYNKVQLAPLHAYTQQTSTLIKKIDQFNPATEAYLLFPCSEKSIIIIKSFIATSIHFLEQTLTSNISAYANKQAWLALTFLQEEKKGHFESCSQLACLSAHLQAPNENTYEFLLQGSILLTAIFHNFDYDQNPLPREHHEAVFYSPLEQSEGADALLHTRKSIYQPFYGKLIPFWIYSDVIRILLRSEESDSLHRLNASPTLTPISSPICHQGQIKAQQEKANEQFLKLTQKVGKILPPPPNVEISNFLQVDCEKMHGLSLIFHLKNQIDTWCTHFSEVQEEEQHQELYKLIGLPAYALPFTITKRKEAIFTLTMLQAILQKDEGSEASNITSNQALENREADSATLKQAIEDALLSLKETQQSKEDLETRSNSNSSLYNISAQCCNYFTSTMKSITTQIFLKSCLQVGVISTAFTISWATGGTAIALFSLIEARSIINSNNNELRQLLGAFEERTRHFIEQKTLLLNGHQKLNAFLVQASDFTQQTANLLQSVFNTTNTYARYMQTCIESTNNTIRHLTLNTIQSTNSSISALSGQLSKASELFTDNAALQTELESTIELLENLSSNHSLSYNSDLAHINATISQLETLHTEFMEYQKDQEYLANLANGFTIAASSTLIGISITLVIYTLISLYKQRKIKAVTIKTANRPLELPLKEWASEPTLAAEHNEATPREVMPKRKGNIRELPIRQTNVIIEHESTDSTNDNYSINGHKQLGSYQLFVDL